MAFFGRPLLSKTFAHLRYRIATGLLLLVPLAVSYIILRFLFDGIDGLLQPAIQKAWGRTVPGTGVVALLLLVYLVGLLGTNILGSRTIKLGEWLLMRIPVVRFVYGTSRQLIQSFSGTSTTGFKRVVAFEYPRPGAWMIGFLTSMTTDEAGTLMAVIYVPTAPTPQTGWVSIVPADQVYETDLSVQEALSFTLSGGIVAPRQIRKSPLRPLEEAPPVK